MKQGLDIFGKAYGVMLRNDVHASHSIDYHFLKTMVLLEDDSKEFLYGKPLAIDMSHHVLFAFSQQFKKATDKESIAAVLAFTSSMAEHYRVPFEEMVFGGTEKEIMERGTDWCADMARVGCVLLQCLGIPCRILHVVDKNKAYHGHVLCEAYYENVYGVVDPLYGFQFYDGNPLDAYYLMKNHSSLGYGYEGYMDLFEAIAINEYDPLAYTNDYTITKPNAYYLRLMRTDHQNQWFMKEE